MKAAVEVTRHRQRRRSICAIGIFLPAALIMILGTPGIAANTAVMERALSEYEVKAAYVYNFAKFVEWPENAFRLNNSPITIGIIGDVEFGTLLEKAVKDKMIQERAIRIQNLKWPADLRGFHIVYVSSSEQKRFRKIAESVQHSPVLTITETEDRSQDKGILNLFIEGGKVQFEVNSAGAEQSGLKISSKLLRLAQGPAGGYSGRGK